MSEIALEGVSRHYGAVRAVDDVTLRAEAGKFLVLLGPSGCGKSTVLRLIAGLEEPTAGRILIGGRDVTRVNPDKRRVSMVFQSYALFPHLSVAENIVFGLKVRRMPKGERAERLARVASLVGLSEQLGRKPSQLSGGQRQRVALAGAIIAENTICLMDEPLSNLDAQLRHGMRVEIRALQQRLGMTVAPAGAAGLQPPAAASGRGRHQAHAPRRADRAASCASAGNCGERGAPGVARALRGPQLSS